MHDFKECETKRRGQKIPLKDKGSRSKITFINKAKRVIREIKVDDCAIKEGKRCDYLVIDHNGLEHFVELKGSDIKHAEKQLNATIEKISGVPKKASKFCFVISRSCPLTTTQVQEMKTRFKKNFNATFLVKTVNYEHMLS